MPGLLDRLDLSSGPPRLRSSGHLADEVLGPLESGEAPAELVRRLGIAPADLLVALALAGLGPDEHGGPPLVQASPSRPKLLPAARPEALAQLFPSSPRPVVLALAAGLLQVLDAWEPSHEAAQRADDLGERSTSAFWHGIAHRREPDAWNSGYWFRRVGSHPVFPLLASAARPLLDAHADPSLSSQLLPGGRWDPFAFIDLCTRTPSSPVARSLQRLEMSLLLDTSLSALL